MQKICEAAAPQLDMRGLKVEKATHDLIALMLENKEEVVIAADAGSGRTTPTNPRSHSKVSTLTVLEEVELRPGELAQQRAQQKEEELRQEAKYLLEHFSQRNLEALIRCTKNNLDRIKRRVSSPSALLYGDSTNDKKRDHRPAFKVRLTLVLPSIALKPSLEGIQGALNEAVHCIVGVHKGVYQWGQGREEQDKGAIASTSQAVLGSHSHSGIGAVSVVMKSSHAQLTLPKKPLKDFFRAVSEHKEVAKLISLTSTTISSAKVLVTHVLQQFKKYEHIWAVEREEHMKEFMESSPGLPEFEAHIREYEKLEIAVMDEAPIIPVGSLAVITGSYPSFIFPPHTHIYLMISAIF